MLFEARHGNQFNGFPINKYRFNLGINESCFAIRMILDDEEEYILAHCSSMKRAKSKHRDFVKCLGIKTDIIKVTRVNGTQFEYEAQRKSSIPIIGTPYGKFKQSISQKLDIDDYTIGGRYLYEKIQVPLNKKAKLEEPGEFDIDPSYLASECIKDNPLFDDEFTIGASYASDDFYQYQTRYLKSLSKEK